MNQSSQTRTALDAVLLRCRRAFYVAAACSGVINCLMLLPALYMLQVYDRVLTSRNETTLWMLTLLALGLYLALGLLDFARAQLLLHLGNQVDAALQRQVYDSAFKHQLARGGGNPAQALQDLAQLRQFFGGNALNAFFDLPWTPLYLLVVYLIHPLLGLLATVGSLLLLALAWLNERATRQPLTSASQLAREITAQTNSQLRNAEAIEALGMLPALRQRWQQGNAQLRALQTQAAERAASISGASRAVRIALQSLILGGGALLVLAGSITAGMMITGSILQGRALAPVEMAIASWKQWLHCRASWERLRALLQHYPATQTALALPRPQGRLHLDNVFASAPGGGPAILKALSFSLQAGQTLGVMGPSAAGKSTLARVLVGIWPTQGGKVRLDGADVAQWPREQLGPWLGYLPQDVELLDGSIADNIARFSAVDDAEVVRAAQQAGIHEAILRLPQGYETRIGAGGHQLSGGQRQGVGLARALYGEPALLVLDEPNANLDDAGEAALLACLQGLKQQGRSVVLITHRLKLLAAVDQLLLLMGGMAQACGPRDEVLLALGQPLQGGKSRTPARARE